MHLRTCKKCGWVHFGVSRGFAEEDVARFAKYFETLTPEQQQDYYGGRPSTVEDTYEKCDSCGGSYKDFQDFQEGDCPAGCTIGPIIVEKDD